MTFGFLCCHQSLIDFNIVFVISRYKPNMITREGHRLDNNFECFTIGFFSLEGTRTMKHFNFKSNESRSNVVTANAVMTKYKHSGDMKPVNVYQKPKPLLNWMVGHFNRPKEWVLDLLASSGTKLVSCMANGRHCVAVEVDPR
jgi:DNA modification methylase